MSSVHNINASPVPIQVTLPSKINGTQTKLQPLSAGTPCWWLWYRWWRRIWFSLVFSVGMGSLEDYKIVLRGRRTHRSKVDGDTVGNRFLWQGRRIVRKGFSGGAVGRYVARQRRWKRGMSCEESPGCTGYWRERRRRRYRRGCRIITCWRVASVRGMRQGRRWRSLSWDESSVLLGCGRHAIDEVVRQGRPRRHLDLWNLTIEVVARRRLRRSQELILVTSTVVHHIDINFLGG